MLFSEWEKRIAVLRDLLDGRNARWYDPPTSSVRYSAGKLDTLTMVIQPKRPR